MRNDGEERGAMQNMLPCDPFPACRVLLATRLSSRMRGLLFAPEGDGMMVLLPCHDIHTFGMAYAIDVAFVDAAGRVVRSVRDVLPNKRLRERDAVAVLERRAIPRELWFEEGEQIALGAYRREPLSANRAAASDGIERDE